MALLNVLTAPDSRLKEVALPVASVNDEIRQLMDDMLETMYHYEGIGLAATQVGVKKRIVVMDIDNAQVETELSFPLKMVNPEILSVSSNDKSIEEGCLSVPGQYAAVTRPEEITVRYLDEFNETHTINVDGIVATCIQHEIDHLDGILFIDHLTQLKRSMLLRKLLKDKKYKVA